MSKMPPAKKIELASQSHDGKPEAPITLSVHDAGEGFPVVFSHGFPELAFSWRHQIAALAKAGFRAIAPDQRGYGESSAPTGSEAYDIAHLTGDLVGLLDALEIEKAVFAGHDWGGFVVWAMPILHPERTAGVIGINTPYLPRSEVAPTQMMRLAAGGDDERIYILWFQEPGVAEGVLDQQTRLVFDRLMRRAPSVEEMTAQIAESGGDMNPFRRLEELDVGQEPLLSPEELDVYVDSFEKSGFRGGISWYRNFDRNWQRFPQIGTEKVLVPSLMVTAERDLALPPALAVGMEARVPDLEIHEIAECGHWTQQEKPEELNRILVDWLRARFS